MLTYTLFYAGLVLLCEVAAIPLFFQGFSCDIPSPGSSDSPGSPGFWNPKPFPPCFFHTETTSSISSAANSAATSGAEVTGSFSSTPTASSSESSIAASPTLSSILSSTTIRPTASTNQILESTSISLASISTESPTFSSATTSQPSTTTSVLPIATGSPIATNGTANTSSLLTWWHETGETNQKTAVRPGNVRQSHLYSVQVSPIADDTYYNSFVYETIPRNGNGNILIPDDPTSTGTEDDDGISIEGAINMTMGWTQFLYQSDVSVRIHRLDGFRANESDIVIRPTPLNYSVSDSDGDIYVTVPYSSRPIQFSVEFSDILYDFRNSCNGTNCGFVQDVDPSGPSYVKKLTDTQNPIMGTEPLHSLLIFASPFETSDMIPDTTNSSTLTVEPGLVTGLDKTTANTVIFNPGVYYFTGTDHANLSDTVDWVYLAPGAYIKGAIQFWTHAATIKATGHGVLSGEQYVYQSNPADGYKNNASNENSLRMWMGQSYSSTSQTFELNGPTTANPPFNSLDFHGDLSSISIHATDYKQVGAFFAQTDGATLYTNSQISNTFYHSNDDTIKTYGSNITVENITVWKGNTAPTIQFGWASRNLSNILINNIEIIHSRYNTNGSHPSLIGSNQIYDVSESLSNTADLSNTISNFYISNIRSEGLSGNLMRICPLANFQNFTIENVSIEAFADGGSYVSESEFPVFTDKKGNVVGVDGFMIRGFEVGGQAVSIGEKNYGTSAIGVLNIAEQFLKSKLVEILS